MTKPGIATASPTIEPVAIEQRQQVLDRAPRGQPAYTTYTRSGTTPYRDVRDVPQPTADGGRITDLAGYGLQRSAGLAAALDDFEARIDAPVYVVTLPSIGAPKSGVKAFATKLFNEWRIGFEGTQKGVLVLIVKDVRRIEVEVASCLNGVVSHSYTTRMLANDVTPILKEGDYARGVRRAVERL